MGTLDEFGKRIETELARGEAPSQHPGGNEALMAEIQQRHAQFQEIATRLMSQVIRPRADKLVSYFNNAVPAKSGDPLHYSCRFGYSDRCPSSMTLDIRLSHDEQIRELIVSYELLIVPVFIKYDRFDRYSISLDSMHEASLAIWIEDRLIEFLHTFQRLERVDRDQSDILVTDPVCGMRINRSGATAQAEYKGHPYYFCSPVCKQTFVQAPEKYVFISLG